MKFIRATIKPSVLRFVYYVRPGYKRLRLPNLPANDPAFIAAYAEAAQGVEKAPSKRAAGGRDHCRAVHLIPPLCGVQGAAGCYPPEACQGH